MTATLLQRWRSARKRFGLRLVAGMLAMSLPIMALLAVVLVTHSSHSLTSASKDKGVTVAKTVGIRMQDWLSERRENLSLIAGQASGQAASASAGLVTQIDKTYADFLVVEITDLTGKVIASSRPA